MKKFYILIFAGVFILSSFFSQGQTTYNSITSNPSNYTLDDIRFWQGGLQPPNPCTNCIINIYSNVTMVQNGFSSVPSFNTCVTNPIPCAFLNDVQIFNSTLNVYGNTTLTINTYLELFNSMITLGNDPTSVEFITLNDQVDLNGTSSIVLANQFTTISAIDIGASTIAGPHFDIGSPTTKSPGIFEIIPPDVNGYDYTWVLNQNGLGSSTNEYFPSPGFTHYILNCNPPGTGSPNVCQDGFVFGPATTTADPLGTGLIVFTESTTLPVQLVLFLATKNDDGSVKVSWATSQEQNSDYYDVERSGDQASWSSIGTVKAKGYASTTTNYFLNDQSPLNGIGYYRLKMVDLDGKFVYSKTVTVTTENTSVPLVVYSNPFSDQIRLKINLSKPQNLMMTVSDMQGKTYITQSYQAQSGDNMVNIVPPVTSSGMYILRIQGDTYNQTIKLEKQ